jgi:polar amino acid transport system substrate-binding protein
MAKLTKPTQISLAAIGMLILALIGGYLGAGLRGGDTASATGTAAEATWMETIKQNGELRVGVAIAPPMTVKKGDELGGPNLIPLQNLADQLGVKLTPVPAEWKNIVAGLQANRYDVAANLDATLERSISIQFSDPVYEYQGVFVIKGDSNLATAEDIIKSGEPVATAQGSAPANAVKEAGAKTLDVGDYTNALQAVQAGRAVAVFTDLPTAESQVQADDAYKIVVPSPKIYEAGAGYGLANTIDTRSLQTINIAINTARMSGELERAYEAENYVTIENLGDLEKKS